MAINVIFQKGTKAQYDASAKTATTFYYVDEKDLYLGTIKLSNASDLSDAISRIEQNENDITEIKEFLNDLEGDSLEDLLEALERRLQNQIGSLNNLTTTEKGNLVGAINEVKGNLDTAKTNLTVTLTPSDSEEYAKVYTLKQGTSTVGTINIPKDMVVSKGEIVVDPQGQPKGTYIVLTIANATQDKLYIPVEKLIDIYTAQKNATQVQLAISDENEISATIVAKSIGTTELADAAVTEAKLATDAVTTNKIKNENVTYEKLSDDVQTSLDLADNAVQSITEGTAKGTISVDGVDVKVHGLKTAAFADITEFDAAGKAENALKEAKTYVDNALTWNTIK